MGSVLPGMPPIRATALPEPLALPDNYKVPSTNFFGMPSTLPPGLELYQPDEEVSPTCLSTPHGAGPLLSTMQWPPSAPQSSVATPIASAGPLLSTIPWASSAPQSSAATPAACATPRLHDAPILDPMAVVAKMGLIADVAPVAQTAAPARV